MMEEKLIKMHENVLIAFSRGYKVLENGTLIGPNGIKSIKLYGKQRYPNFTLTINNRVQSIVIHYLAAFCFYGYNAFNKNLVVRHLDSNTLNVSKSNIKLGSHSENNLDKNKTIRKSAAKKARASQGYRAKNAKFNNDEIRQIRKLSKSNKVSDIANKFNVTKGCIYNIINNEVYKDVN